ncbi:zinc finger and BTB domain-containing protein 24-like isoform X2 [Bombyx mandarina]|uniref:BTB domain-containing protein n=2 Tax=Bombyx TaxID=7090 RepID=A0A8R2C9P0_BOMMO|nr:zinc finger and BTB domain-containing protein 24 isoform X2 [Bombyx mori]XP_028033874.1 zinc finger and BTB domain-containing protein 24-like isoform X2 [Bombyx mandarina]
MSQQYSLRWNNHQPNFISMFTTLLNTQTLVDVTLAAEGKHLQAHKVVLSACSTYFQALFVDNPSRHPIVILKDVTFADLRTMVDFMYYGEVNVTEEQLPQVLDTAKLLKIKGLTEMPDSTSLTRSQGTSADFQSPGESVDSQRHSASPASSPSNKRKRFVRRKSSTGSTSLNMVMGEEHRSEEAHNIDMMRESITLSSVPQQRRRDYHDDRTVENSQQTTDQQNMNIDQVGMDANTGGIQQESIKVDPGLKLRRSKHFKRQNRVADDRDMRKQCSEPAVSTPPLPVLQKHESYPQYATKNRRSKPQEREVGSLLIRAVTVIDRQSSGGPSAAAASSESGGEGVTTQRARHTPAVRSGPPLSCNFCWNTVDECGRILRRKTQYHCPECRTNLCIVPCFHEYHDSPDAEPGAGAR